MRAEERWSKNGPETFWGRETILHDTTRGIHVIINCPAVEGTIPRKNHIINSGLLVIKASPWRFYHNKGTLWWGMFTVKTLCT